MNQVLTDNDIRRAISHLYAGPEVLDMAFPLEIDSARAIEAAVLSSQYVRKLVEENIRLKRELNRLNGVKPIPIILKKPCPDFGRCNCVEDCRMN